jgi:predicted RNA-binding Zn-ribbon protein involved in translation (DUF1610 family)
MMTTTTSDKTIPPPSDPTSIVPPCPRCGGPYGAEPVLSRRDDATYICSACGREEAHIDSLTPAGRKTVPKAWMARERRLARLLARGGA